MTRLFRPHYINFCTSMDVQWNGFSKDQTEKTFGC